MSVDPELSRIKNDSEEKQPSAEKVTFEHAYFEMMDQFNSSIEQLRPKKPGLIYTFFDEDRTLQNYRFNKPLRSVKQRISCCKKEGDNLKEKIQDMLKLVESVAKAMARDIQLEVKSKPRFMGDVNGATDMNSFSEIFTTLNGIMIEMVNFAFDYFDEVLDPVDKFLQLKEFCGYLENILNDYEIGPIFSNNFISNIGKSIGKKSLNTFYEKLEKIDKGALLKLLVMTRKRFVDIFPCFLDVLSFLNVNHNVEPEQGLDRRFEKAVIEPELAYMLSRLKGIINSYRNLKSLHHLGQKVEIFREKNRESRFDKELNEVEQYINDRDYCLREGLNNTSCLQPI